ncbi:Aste57867_10175 [Aphanomyces stellatus]|uniref:Aste57867_10175 protein n=1 Tax=Aphanomyces stellatus TaxID=120398 RepID=A0A485KPS3_9STRA|nr:hypothetical protein As57867_010136 [Aphanomyces stellatus]VFT87051.1 Aste57867_10175 [Aphanomyces stellatus]
MALPQHAVLLSRELMATVASFQRGHYAMAMPFVSIELPVRHARGCSWQIFNSTALDVMHAALVDWLEVWSVVTLPKLFACLPYMREVIAQDAVWFNQVSLVQHLHETFGLASFATCLVDVAAEANNMAMLQMLHGLGCQSHSADAAEWAAGRGNLPMVEYLYRHGLGLCEVDKMTWSRPSRGHVQVLAFLLDHHDSNHGQISTQAMVMAARKGWVDLVDRLNTMGAPYTNAVLRVAAMFGHVDVVQWVHCHRPDQQFREAVYAAANKGHLPVIESLHDQHVFPANPISASTAAANGHLDVLLYLHRAGLCYFSWDAVEQAARHGHLAVVQWLLDYKLDLQWIDATHEWTAQVVDDAAGNNHLDVVQWLVQHCHAPVSTDAMDYAAKNGHLGMVQWLHEHTSVGCTVNAVDFAAENNHMEVVQWLLANRVEGCSINAMNWAAQQGHLEMIEFLHATRPQGCTTNAMDSAASNGHLKVVQWLHSHRNEGCTRSALHQASKNGDLKMVKWLLANRVEVCAAASACFAFKTSRILTARVLVDACSQWAVRCLTTSSQAKCGCACYEPLLFGQDMFST